MRRDTQRLMTVTAVLLLYAAGFWIATGFFGGVVQALILYLAIALSIGATVAGAILVVSLRVFERGTSIDHSRP